MTREVDQLIMPNMILSEIPPTFVDSRSHVDMKREPFSAINLFREEGAILGTVDGLENYKVVFPSKQHVSEEDGTHIMVVPVYDEPVSFIRIPEEDSIKFLSKALPLINRGVSLSFNESPNLTMQTSQTLGTLHFHIHELPANTVSPDEQFLNARVIEPYGQEMSDILQWHFTRPNYEIHTPSNAFVDSNRIKQTGFPSGGIAFSFEKDVDVKAPELNSYLVRILSTYRLLHDSMFDCLIYREAYLATQDLKGEYMQPKPRPIKESEEMLQRFFFRHEGFPDSGKKLLYHLREVVNETDVERLDLVKSYTIAVCKEERSLKVLLDPHMNKIGGSLEIFGSSIDRQTTAAASLDKRISRARELALQLA